MKLDIIYEDKEIIVCYKPSGVATQTASLSSPDVVSMIKNYLAKQTKEKSPYVGVIHRLDQPVSGLLVFAKTQKSAASLSKQIQDGNANKDYIAFCTGNLEEKQGTLVHYIAKDSASNLARVISEEEFILRKQIEEEQEVADFSKKERLAGKKKITNKSITNLYKKAVLNYEVEKEFEDCSIIKVHLQTGRFHQIRAQFSYIGHALLGDVKYGDAMSCELSKKRRINKTALCAYSLVIKHPSEREEMKLVLDEKYLPIWYS